MSKLSFHVAAVKEADVLKTKLLQELTDESVKTDSNMLHYVDSLNVERFRAFVKSFPVIPSLARPVYMRLAELIQAIENCKKGGNDVWQAKHESRLRWIIKESGPSGSGIDNGTHVYLESCEPEKLVLACSFHHMNENGFYDGWTDHKLIIRPSLLHRYTLDITGRDRNQIKDYLHEVYRHWLDSYIDESDYQE